MALHYFISPSYVCNISIRCTFKTRQLYQESYAVSVWYIFSNGSIMVSYIQNTYRTVITLQLKRCPLQIWINCTINKYQIYLLAICGFLKTHETYKTLRYCYNLRKKTSYFGKGWGQSFFFVLFLFAGLIKI